VPHSLADISRAEESLGYRPAIEFTDGLRRTVEHHQTGRDQSASLRR
jgi:nucleoside-diphosphate-sugar epimerase